MIKHTALVSYVRSSEFRSKGLSEVESRKKAKVKSDSLYKYASEYTSWGVPMIRDGAYYELVNKFRDGFGVSVPASVKARTMCVFVEAHMYDSKSENKNTFVGMVSDPVLHTSTVEFESTEAYELAEKIRKMVRIKDMGESRAVKISTVTYGGAYKNRGRLAILTAEMDSSENSIVTYANLSNSTMIFYLVKDAFMTTCKFTDATLSVLNDVYMAHFADGTWYDYETNDPAETFFVCTHVNRSEGNNKYESRLMVYPLGSATDMSSSHIRITGEGKIQYSGKPKHLTEVTYAVKVLVTTAIKTSYKAFIKSMSVVEDEKMAMTLIADSCTYLGKSPILEEVECMHAYMTEGAFVSMAMNSSKDEDLVEAEEANKVE